MLRIGHGLDVHKLVENRKLILCGVEIPHKYGLLGHSDADVATHALIDAFCGALAIGDIGMLFPDNCAEYKDINSIILLKRLLQHKKFENVSINNIDITIVAEKPKIMPYREQMIKTLSEALLVTEDCISVKATTTEKLGFCGREEGITAIAVVLVEKS